MPTVPTPPLTLTITGDNGLRDEIEATTEAIRDFWALLRPWIDRAEGLLATASVAEVKWAEANVDEAWPPSSQDAMGELFRSVIGTDALYSVIAEVSKVHPDASLDHPVWQEHIAARRPEREVPVDRPVCELGTTDAVIWTNVPSQQLPDPAPASADAEYSATLKEIRRNLPEDRTHLIYRLDGLVGERMLQAADDEASAHRRIIEGLIAAGQAFLDVSDRDR